MKIRAWRNVTAAAALALLLPAIMLSACGDDAATTTEGTGAGTGTGGSGGSGSEEGICLLNNCSDDSHCKGCPDGRDVCLVEESRCVACTPGTTEGCPEGEECSSFGLCVPEGLTCPTDDEGNPQVTCTQNSDCLACSPMHQVCDTATGTCQACTETNTQHCLQSDICADLDGDGRPESCSPKCPPSCETDNDCMHCGGPGNEAHACNAHKCAECSDTFPCPAGLECNQGVCTPTCGLPGPEAGTCLADEDCEHCGDSEDTSDSWTCNKPVNNDGPNDHGTCAPAAAGCSDLGEGVAVLPAPYDQYTNLCSNDGDCSGVGIQYNVGKAIRDLVGSDQLDLGFTKIKISDADVEYPMPICADVEINEDLSCGICVPCEEDSDCQPIQVDPLIGDLFQDEALAQIAGALLIDLLWGDNEDHSLHFFCQQVAAGYGACIPCANPLQPCGTGGGGMGTGSCDHDVCTEGAALNTSCSQCAADVCNADPFCCDAENGKWDSLCVNQADQLCGNICTGGGGSACSHDPCTTGDALTESCNQCVTDICARDPYCCNTESGSWDNICTSYADANDSNFVSSCTGACDGGCAHSECVSGAALDPSCSTCAGTICSNDSFCCDTEWDSICVSAAENETDCSCN